MKWLLEETDKSPCFSFQESMKQMNSNRITAEYNEGIDNLNCRVYKYNLKIMDKRNRQLIDLQPKQLGKRQQLVKKQYENQQTTESASSSSQTGVKQRKRGFSLSKQHSIKFDRMYAPKDLIPDNPNSRVLNPNSQATDSTKRTTHSTSKTKLSLQGVKSEKNLAVGSGESEGCHSRITIGGNDRSGLQSEQDGHIHKFSYGQVPSSRKGGRKREEKTEYGLVRK